MQYPSQPLLYIHFFPYITTNTSIHPSFHLKHSNPILNSYKPNSLSLKVDSQKLSPSFINKFMGKPDDPPQPSESDEILTGKILLIIFLIYFALMCMIFSCLGPHDRRRRCRSVHWRQPRLVFSNRTEPSPCCLDQNIIDSIPVIELSLHGDDEVSDSCAVCISEFTDGEKLRALPQCGHRFHLECINMWFASHSTCPLCRTDINSSSPNSDQQVQLGETENLHSIIKHLGVPIQQRL